MRRFVSSLAAFVIASTVWLGGAQAEALSFEESFVAVTPPTRMPLTPFLRLDAEPTDLSAWRGRPMLVVFWATWCHVCRHEMPAISALAARLEPRGVGVAPLSVDVGEDAAQRVAAFYADLGVTNFEPLIDSEHDAAAALGLRETPTTAILDSEGRVHGVMIGAVDWSDPAILAFLKIIDAPEG